MAKPPFYDPAPAEQNPINSNHCYSQSEECPKRSRGFCSFFAVVCSVFVYVSIFYVFNLSPSTFLYNNKFWFFISNTLILIISVDYGAFSSSGETRCDAYEEYVMHRQSRSNSGFSQYQETPSQKTTTVKKETLQLPAEDLPEVIKREVTVNHLSSNKKAPEKLKENIKPKVAVRNKLLENPGDRSCVHEKVAVEARPYRRSKSDKSKRVVFDESKNKNILHRSETEIREEPAADTCFGREDNDFSSMSDEELNRRVEEFIQKFNKQIRLQRAGKLHEI